MKPLSISIFHLPEDRAAKADPALIGTDEQHLTEIAACLEQSIAELTDRLAETRRAPGGGYQRALERDQEVHRLTARLRTLRRFGLDLVLGRIVPADADGPTYVGRIGLSDATGRHLVVDWRSPVAEPFFGATHADPMGLTSRRRYRWTRGRITDYWDEVFAWDDSIRRETLDDQSRFIASLGATRTDRMRDVLGTIQADQDAIIRADSRGALVVDGGPGTGKTVVALHRTAYLLYSDPRLGHHRGGVLFIGPSEPYLSYVADVLPSLGEEGVRTCTLRDLVAEGAAAVPESDPQVAALKAQTRMVDAIDRAVRFSEEPPDASTTIETDWGDVTVGPDEWAEAFEAPEAGTPHNEAREVIAAELVEIILRTTDLDAPEDQVRPALLRSRELRNTLHRAWPMLDAAEVVGDLWTVPTYLRWCAPWLSADDIARLHRADGKRWTVSDLPLLDAARHQVGDARAADRDRRRSATLAARRGEMNEVVEALIESDDSEMAVMSMLRGADLRNALDDESDTLTADPDVLVGAFAHVVVDEAQELTDAQWRMVLRRCPSRSVTVVGDRGQARHGFTESWTNRLRRVGFDQVRQASLRINYRTPVEIMEAAGPVIRAVLPDVTVPTSVRSTGRPVRRGTVAELDAVLDAWTAADPDGIGCVIGDPTFPGRPRIRSLSPETAKGLEFDLVVLVDTGRPAATIEQAVDRYVAMTRATQELVVLIDR
ncbi:RNA polymerase recycling motor ATPase HelR [Nakamurella leprariae]|uniref:AAA family ATPase n=1 Tax=Nakamurella leprariae TaxID=2803911 RepID=A0A938YGB1_9ACTN|nr:RNA polymerase recycling motor ATPase HelR [Nakamurella leprariae]MBM9469063.1 AAA family ATPase [Nakamurella leprariae]